MTRRYGQYVYNFQTKPTKHGSFIGGLLSSEENRGIYCTRYPVSLKSTTLTSEAVEDKRTIQPVLWVHLVYVSKRISKGWHQIRIIKVAVDSLNLAICKASSIPSIRNTMDSYQEAYIFFHNSLILQHAIKCKFPTAKKKRLVNCAVQGGLKGIQLLRQFSIFLFFLCYHVEALNGKCYPSSCELLHPDGNNWK